MKVLILNASLTDPNKSTTRAITKVFAEKVQEFLPCTPEIIDLIKLDIQPVIGNKIKDDWQGVLDKMMAAEIVVFATPIWWNNHSSLMQRTLERMDDLTDMAGYGTGKLDGKVAGIIVKGSEDGGQHVQAGLMEPLTYFGFLLPAYCGYFTTKDQDDKQSGQLTRMAKSLVRAALEKQ